MRPSSEHDKDSELEQVAPPGEATATYLLTVLPPVFSGPTDPFFLPGSVEIAVVVSAATVASCMLGLVLSGFVPSRDAALPALVIATMVQVVFSGAIPLRSDWLLDAFGWAMPAYWEFEAMAASVDLSALTGNQSGIWLHEVQQWWTGVGVLGLMAAGFVVLATLVSRRHDPGRR